jgi:hypothetical protein
MVERTQKKVATMKIYQQNTNSKRVYHVDIVDDSHPVAVRPVWSVTNARDGAPVASGIAALETRVDAMTARITSHEWSGLLKVTVVVGVHPRTTITQGFEIEIVPVPDLSQPLSIEFSQHRDRPI